MDKKGVLAMYDAALWAAIAAVALATIVGIMLIVLIRKHIIPIEAVEETSELLGTLDVSGNGFAVKLYEYVKIAVSAVEQMAKTGVIENKGAAKKAAAMDYTEQIAKADEIELTPEEKAVADLMIEAAVAELPRNQKESAT